jgi:hypothetical protein
MITIAEEAVSLKREIRNFDEESEEKQYTDTDKAWGIFYATLQFLEKVV